jgi:hypothetical protein
LLENSLDNASADAELPADLEDAVTIRPKFKYSRLYRRFDPTPAQLSTVCPCASETCVHPFPNDPTLELCEHAQHLKHRLAGGRRTIESLLVKEQADSLFMKALEYAEQVSERSAEPIH